MSALIGIIAAMVGLVFIGAILDGAVDKLDEAEEETSEEPELRDEDGDGDPDYGIYKIPDLTDEDSEDGIGADTEIFYLRAGAYAIPDGSVSIKPDGSFAGLRAETNDYDGAAPPTVDQTEIEGHISQGGTVTGKFTGTDTYVRVSGSGYEYDVRDVTGNVSGQIFSDGSYVLNWTGPEPGSKSGQLPSTDLGAILAAALGGPFLMTV